MKVFEEKIELDREDGKTHFPYSFHLEGDYKRLQITLQYEPSVVPEVLAKKLARTTAEAYIPKGYAQYDMVFEIMENFRILNILTISLSKDGKFIGSYHNDKNNQTIVISEEEASRGFTPVKISEGDYTLTLSTLNVNSKVTGILKVEVY